MVGLYRSGGFAIWAKGRRVLVRIREWWIVEDLGRRCYTGSNDECLDTKPAPEVLDGIAIIVRLHIPLIPRQSKGCIGHLDHEEVETGIRGQAGCHNKHVFGLPIRNDVNLRSGIGKTVTCSW